MTNLHDKIAKAEAQAATLRDELNELQAREAAAAAAEAARIEAATIEFHARRDVNPMDLRRRATEKRTSMAEVMLEGGSVHKAYLEYVELWLAANSANSGAGGLLFRRAQRKWFENKDTIAEFEMERSALHADVNQAINVIRSTVPKRDWASTPLPQDVQGRITDLNSRINAWAMSHNLKYRRDSGDYESNLNTLDIIGSQPSTTEMAPTQSAPMPFETALKEAMAKAIVLTRQKLTAALTAEQDAFVASYRG